MKHYNAVVTILSGDQLYFSHYGVLDSDGKAKLSKSHRTDGYATTDFDEIADLNKAVFHIVNNQELIRNLPKAEDAYSIEIEVRKIENNKCKILYKISLGKEAF